ncbi:family 78 glycoside hydrolase catalytic domain [Alistipes sp. cv1]|jgi:bacterial alpha-L-rhamnosidase|uniref:alpha-L-rhamnosidase n=2 Tax=Alistipes TaxID=239759 RepID=A0ABR7CNF0_9BACT|nr:family 78 glycoside hydrolase catalytic domain [Alistipes hominis]MBS1415215.1 family 78 glycoside hydrolase catalytic domain [Alistipes sp.]RHR62550.1 glycoside hydrolase [Alistipes sp. AF17-16]
MTGYRINTVCAGAALTVFLLSGCAQRRAEIADMRCEYMSSPIGIGANTPPRFTWNYTGDDDFVQQRCRVRVASTKAALADSLADGDVWSSPEIVSVNGFAQYDAPQPLEPRTRYYWNAVAWGDDGRIVVSPVDSFETAQADLSGWTARWITDGHDKRFAAAPMLRKSFDVTGEVRDARLYMSAAAYGKMRLNGKPVTPNRLEPGYTHYDKRNLYGTYDVTGLLVPGENVLSAVLGNGFYNEDAPVATWDFENARWRDRARMIGELHIVYADGSQQVVASDGTWKTATGPYVQNNIYSGDTYDARLEIPGWDEPGFDDAAWSAAVEIEAPSPLLVAQTAPAIRATREIRPVAVKSFGDTVYVFDFGENMAGVCRLSVQGEKGTKITMQHGELQKANGRVEMGNIDIYYKPLPGLAFQTDTYTLKGEGVETFTPDFTYHGFQYVEVKSDRPVKLNEESLTALFVHTAVEPVGTFSCSNELMNKIWKATNQSYLSNLHSIPTDCPQREKNGWTADAHISIDLALLNFDGIRFYEKWLDDFVDNQREDGSISGIIPSSGWGYADWIGPVWDAAMFIIPNALYDYYGDKRAIEKMYPVCEKYLGYLQAREDQDGTVTYGIGDWVPYKTQTPTDYTTTCFYYLDQALMTRFAELTGRDGAAYAKKAENLKELINKKYFNADSATYANGSQAALATALALGLVPQQYEQRVADRLAQSVEASNGHLDFGMLGSKFALRMLTKYGYADLAYRMAAQEDCPSWGGWINRGFTTLAETWQLSEEFRDASINHVFLGDVSAWMYNDLAGINFDPQQPGFRHILFRPHFVEGLDWVKAEYRSVNGPIRSEWKRDGGKVRLTVDVPVNTTGTVIVGDKEIPVSAGVHEFKF